MPKPFDKPSVVHLATYNLEVVKRMAVGRVEFRPSRWLGGHLERTARRHHELWGGKSGQDLDGTLRRLNEDLEVRYASANVRANSVEEARDRAGEAIAVLRLYQRSVAPAINLDQQTFGLRGVIGAVMDRYYATNPGVSIYQGWEWQGVLAEWKFTHEHIDGFYADPRFAWLHAMLRQPGDRRTDLQRQLVQALRFLNMATFMVPPAVRIVLLALALETALGDTEPKGRRTRLSRRNAYLTCGHYFDQRYPKREACFYLAARTRKEVETEQRRIIKLGGDPRCTYYLDPNRIFGDRDRVVHEARRSSGAICRRATRQSWTSRCSASLPG